MITVSVVAVPRTIFYETLYRVRHMLLLLLDLIGLDHGTNERCWTEKQEQYVHRPRAGRFLIAACSGAARVNTCQYVTYLFIYCTRTLLATCDMKSFFRLLSVSV